MLFSIDGDLAATLTDLDVSENRLSPDDLCRLSALKLERLAVSANNLSALPDRITGCRSFLSLGSLDLSDNCLRRPKAFYVLSTLHGLRTLNMSGNRISFVPYLVTKRVSRRVVTHYSGPPKYTRRCTSVGERNFKGIKKKKIPTENRDRNFVVVHNCVEIIITYAFGVYRPEFRKHFPSRARPFVVEISRLTFNRPVTVSAFSFRPPKMITLPSRRNYTFLNVRLPAEIRS